MTVMAVTVLSELAGCPGVLAHPASAGGWLWLCRVCGGGCGNFVSRLATVCRPPESAHSQKGMAYAKSIPVFSTLGT